MTRAAMLTAMPVMSWPLVTTSPTCKPARMGKLILSNASIKSRAHCKARTGPSKIANMPSPVFLTMRPLYDATKGPAMASCSSNTLRQASSPTLNNFSVDPTMSVNNAVDSFRSASKDSTSTLALANLTMASSTRSINGYRLDGIWPFLAQWCQR